MKQSELLAKTKKKVAGDIEPEGYRFLVKGDFVEQLSAGIFSFLPLGYRVIKKVGNIVRQEMNAIAGQEVFLPSLQPKEIWQKTDRWNNMDPPLFKLKDRHKKEFALGSTHEEVITKIAKQRIQSWRDLPLYLYQIQTKFRNEMRATGGLLRNREFLMKDLYSFHTTTEDLDQYFDKVARVYQNIFKRCGLQAIKSEASGGAISGKDSRTLEFQVKAEAGEDTIVLCEKCKFAANLEVSELKAGNSCPKCKGKLTEETTVEAGHIFCLGDKYSKSFSLQYVDKQGKSKPVVMGCYGIGIGRLMGIIAEIHRDEQGLCWPKDVAPFLVHLLTIEAENLEVQKTADSLYQDLQKQGIEVLYDNRKEKSAGEKFADADLIGIPWRIVVSQKTLKNDSVEIKKRKEVETNLVKFNELCLKIKKLKID